MTSTAPLTTLPALNAEEREHAARVSEHIREFIAAQGGGIDFDAFMRLALYAPGLGYYSAGAAKLGAAGDFITAPEISDLFSRSLAQQVAEVLQVTGGDVFELGAGTGRMAADVLKELALLDELPRRYCILEVSADLMARQRQTMAQLPDEIAQRVQWLDRWPTRPLTGVVLANEVLDAMPVHCFTIDASGKARSRAVGAAAAGFEWLERDATPELAAAVADILDAAPAAMPPGYAGEVCLSFAPWLASLAASLEEGVAFLIDYGLPRSQLYHPQRSGGTLRCHFRHRAHDDPFVNVGLQDITAWVDFTRVAEGASAAGFEVLGFATQAAFLIGSGIETLLTTDMDGVDERRRVMLASAARRLLMPDEMGEIFKVMALGRTYSGPLRGFRTQDLRGSL